MRARWAKLIIGLIGLAVVVAGCGSPKAAKTAVKGDTLFTVNFETPGDWEEGSYPEGAANPDAVLAIKEGRYHIDYQSSRSASLTWGVGGDSYQDVILEVSAEQLSDSNDNLYGVACRLTEDENGDMSGYVLLISGDGHYGIAELSRRSLDFLLEWHQSGLIHQGKATNTIRAVCVGDYLAVYANGDFLGEVKNDHYQRAGQVGMVVGANSGVLISVAFDDLTVYAGSLENK